jgi:prepilin-type N-terminal cleavage/methylation domain-containing protein
MKAGQGLSLLEVLISISIMSVLVTAIGYAVSSSLKIGQETRRNQDAVEAAQAVLERYRTLWRDGVAYTCNDEPNLTALLAKLPATYTVTVRHDVAFKPDGSAVAEPDCTNRSSLVGNPPPLRQVTVQIKEGSRMRASLETKMGNPNPQ